MQFKKQKRKNRASTVLSHHRKKARRASLFSERRSKAAGGRLILTGLQKKISRSKANFAPTMAPQVGLEPTTLRRRGRHIACNDFPYLLNRKSFRAHSAAPPLRKEFASLILFGLFMRLLRRVGAASLSNIPQYKEKGTVLRFLSCGSPSWTRTNDPAVNSRMLSLVSK